MSAHSTKDNLLDAAEQLFAEHGFDGASIRDITGLAGANLASINYHFGNKDTLLREVLVRRVKRIIDERARLLRIAMEAAGDSAPTVRSVLNAFISPAVHIAAEHPYFSKLLARVQFEGMLQSVDELIKRTFHNSVQSFVAQLVRALPEVTQEDIRLRLLFSVGSFTFVAMNSKAICILMNLPSIEQDPVVLSRHLVDFCAAGMCAMPPEQAAPPRKRAKR